MLSVLALTSCDMLLPQAPSARKRSSRLEEESELVDDSFNSRSSSQVGSSVHKHRYGPWTRFVEPTCTEKGIDKRCCECGAEEAREVAALGHDWDDGAVTIVATCTARGEKTYHCKRVGCSEIKTEDIIGDHVWGEGTPIEGEYSEAAYSLFTCITCNNAKKIEFAAIQETGKYTLSGMLKDNSSLPDYLKLSSNGDSATYTFNTSVSGVAKIYLRAAIDYWHDGNNENQNRNFFSGKFGDSGNFELIVNNIAVDYSDTRDLTYGDMLPGDTQEGNISPTGDVLVGNCLINSGENTVVYRRLDSYNLFVKDFVIVID